MTDTPSSTMAKGSISGTTVCVGSGIQVDHTKRLSENHNVFKGMLEGKEVAVKKMDFNERFIPEIEKIMGLKKHPNTVEYKKWSEWESAEAPGLKSMYIALELCNRDTLLELIEKRRLTHKEQVTALMQLVLGLSHIHENGIIHGDLKPNNVLRSLDERFWKIADFGITKHSKGKSYTTRTQLAAYGWTAPDKIVSQKSDVYSAGLVFYYVLSGGEGDGVIDLDGLDCPDSVQAKDLIRRMLESDPNNRPSPSEVLAHAFFWPSDKKLSFYCDVVGLLNKPSCKGDHAVIELLTAIRCLFNKNQVWDMLSRNQVGKEIPQNNPRDIGGTHSNEKLMDDRWDVLPFLMALKEEYGRAREGKTESEDELTGIFLKLFALLYQFVKKQIEKSECKEKPSVDWAVVQHYYTIRGLEPVWTEGKKFRFLCKVSKEDELVDSYEHAGPDIFGENWMAKLALDKAEKRKVQAKIEERGSKLKIEKWAVFNRPFESMRPEEMNYDLTSVHSLLRFISNRLKYFQDDGNQVKTIFNDSSEGIWEYFAAPNRFPLLFTKVRECIACFPLYENILSKM